MDDTNVYDLSKLKIVVADPSHFVRRLLAAVLTGLRAPHPYAANSSDVALRIVAETAPDLLIVDWDLQPMNGADVVRALRDEKSSPNPTLPIIMISGHCALGRVTEARDSGANEFIAKPFTVDAIYKRLVALIERPRPFIRLESYFGPDRRRKIEEFAGDERRRVNPNPIVAPEDAA
ncbi:MAG TPA: response regulator [Alphaproteobacteria bacterium]|nr:response regulator [Alphaproteobacteria bacterium]